MKGKVLLQVTGILMMIGGVLNSVIGILSMIGGSLAMRGLDVFLILTSVILLVDGVIELIAGILGVKNCNHPEKASSCLALGIATIVLTLLGAVFNLYTGNNVLSIGNNINVLVVISGLVLPVLYVIGAVLNNQSASPQGTAYGPPYQQSYGQPYQPYQQNPQAPQQPQDFPQNQQDPQQ